MKKTKEPKRGGSFYQSKGLKPITVHVEEQVRTALIEEAASEKRSLQNQVALILEKYVQAIPKP